MLAFAAAIVAGLALLVWAADRFILGSASIARIAGIPPLVIGMTIVGIGTSSPELCVSVLAALQDSSGLAIGNAVGSNICNIALILGACAVIRPLIVKSSILHRELPVCMGVALLLLLLALDGALTLLDAVILTVGFVGVILWMLRSARTGKGDELEREMVEEMPPEISARAAWLWIAVGLVLMVGSSQLLVWGAVNIAQQLGVSELVIGLTIVAVGTSLPEFAASVAGTLKGEDDLAVGNILGSNIFNVLLILPPAALFAPGAFEPAVLTRDIPTMIGITGLLFLFAYGWAGRLPRINRIHGAMFLLVYVGYTLILLQSSGAL